MDGSKQEIQPDVAAPAGGDYVEFFSVGTRAAGPFQCVACGWSTVVFAILTRCPICGEGLWERCLWSPFGAGRPGRGR
jgi:hypothetical protein